MLEKEDKKDIVEMYRSGKYYLKEIAEWIGCSLSTVRRTIEEDRKNAIKR